MTARPSDERELELEPLVDAASAGDEEGWHELWRRLEPRLSAVLRNAGILGPSCRREDRLHDVLVAVMAKLHEDGFRRLQGYLAARRADPALTFMRWVIVVAKRAAIDRMRADPDYIDLRRSPDDNDGRSGAWVETRELPDDASMPGVRPPFTNRVAAREILRNAGGVLTGPQRRAIEMWAEEAPSEDIARELGLPSAEHADRLVRAGVERLRRFFREDEPQ